MRDGNTESQADERAERDEAYEEEIYSGRTVTDSDDYIKNASENW